MRRETILMIQEGFSAPAIDDMRPVKMEDANGMLVRHATASRLSTLLYNRPSPGSRAAKPLGLFPFHPHHTVTGH
jgi:hypothetical protein